MLKKEEAIKINCRTDVLKFIKRRLENIDVTDFYDSKEYDLVRQEYLKMAESIRDLDKITQLKNTYKQNKHISKYFKER